MSDCRADPVNDTSLPQGIQHSSVGEYPDQSVFDSDVMQEGFLGIHNECIRDPKELCQSPIQTQALIAIKTQAFICPALTKKDGGCVVLGRLKRDANFSHVHRKLRFASYTQLLYNSVQTSKGSLKYRPMMWHSIFLLRFKKIHWNAIHKYNDLKTCCQFLNYYSEL